ncbi:YeiH family protein [Lentibacillus salicampi]|uniref:YeiH family putative sulfate export transporter n=1 Tax=Lentibacillus salicampi TaxID=175306 RepID=A0A4Y9A984_9BACI|nr:YeiH family protein [Lentibacillus salicampi]TFJ92429.1 YeiH family putative sulfate export transporter [Lentibacillus salicampi]
MKQSLTKHPAVLFTVGILITLVIALIAQFLSQLPFLSIMGQLVIAILIGIAWRSAFGVPSGVTPGVTFSSKKLLRFGIILLGMRLNLVDIYEAGWNVFMIAALNLTFAFIVVFVISRWMGVDKKLGVLTAGGTAICGAAAIVAIAPQVKAKDDETAVGVATIAVLGTLFTLVYTFLYSLLDLSQNGFGIFAGGTLHEIAHVVAAAAAGGDEAVDIAVIVKLTRVALLVPVVLLIGYFFRGDNEGTARSRFSWSTIPWFIFGFLAVSAINSLGVVPQQAADQIVNLAYLLLAMAMAGIGLGVDIGTFRRLGLKSFTAGLIGSVLLAVFGFLLVSAFGLF